jgi:hypothetical protein
MAIHRQSDGSPVNWHSAFFEAIQIELVQFSAFLEFRGEIPLNAAPLRLDVLVVKKQKDAVISKNIARIFRSANIIEYKSPGDYVSVEDFYKAYGCTCLYASLEHIPITECTLTFVESRHPRELLAHIRGVRGYGVEERGAGIYTVSGDIVPIQVIETRRLSDVENLWLRNLDDRLGAKEIWEVAGAVKRLGKGAKAGAYLEVIARANLKRAKEALEMRKKESEGMRYFRQMVEMIDEWENTGIEKGRNEGREEGMDKGKREVAEKLVARGWPPEEVVETTGLDVNTVRSLYGRGE